MRVLALLTSLLLIGCDKAAEDKSPTKSKVPVLGTRQHDMELRAFIGLAPPGPKVFTLKCAIADSYIGDFCDARETHYSIHMRDRYGTAIWGYVEKDSPLGRRLASLLSDGAGHVITVAVRRTKTAREVEVLRIVE